MVNEKTVYCETDRMVIYEQKDLEYKQIHYYSFLKDHVRETNGEPYLHLVDILLSMFPSFYCDNANLGMHVCGSENRNKGYMSEALMAIRDSIVENKMEACAWADNIASCKVLGKIFPHCKEKEVDKIVSFEGLKPIREKNIVKIFTL